MCCVNGRGAAIRRPFWLHVAQREELPPWRSSSSKNRMMRPRAGALCPWKRARAFSPRCSARACRCRRLAGERGPAASARSTSRAEAGRGCASSHARRMRRRACACVPSRRRAACMWRAPTRMRAPWRGRSGHDDHRRLPVRRVQRAASGARRRPQPPGLVRGRRHQQDQRLHRGRARRAGRCRGTQHPAARARPVRRGASGAGRSPATR